jgi:t-SNARE complex subunit (syntaxin)
MENIGSGRRTGGSDSELLRNSTVECRRPRTIVMVGALVIVVCIIVLVVTIAVVVEKFEDNEE